MKDKHHSPELITKFSKPIDPMIWNVYNRERKFIELIVSTYNPKYNKA